MPTKIYLISDDSFLFKIFEERLNGLNLKILSKTQNNFQTSELIRTSDVVFVYNNKNGKEELNEAKMLKKRIYNLDSVPKDKLEEVIRDHIDCLQFHETYCDTNFIS